MYAGNKLSIPIVKQEPVRKNELLTLKMKTLRLL